MQDERNGIPLGANVTISCSDDEFPLLLTGSQGIECFSSFWSVDASSSYGSSVPPTIAGTNRVSDIDKNPVSACLQKSGCYVFRVYDLSGGVPGPCDGDFASPPFYDVSLDGAVFEDASPSKRIVASNSNYISLKFGRCFDSTPSDGDPSPSYTYGYPADGVSSNTKNDYSGRSVSTGSGNVFGFLFFFLFFAICLGICCCRKDQRDAARRRRNGRPQVAPSGQQTEEQSSQQQPNAQQQSEGDVQTQIRESRTMYIKENLRTQTLEAKDAASLRTTAKGETSQHGSTCSILTSKRRSDTIESSIHSLELRLANPTAAAATADSTAPPVKYSEEVCTICLEEYGEGDVVGRSANSGCVHIFHAECISEWLVKNDECPNCRLKYLDESANV